jgi:hypothetical protein
MITINLDGGLGNQMFQYAAACSLAESLNTPLTLNTHEFNKAHLRRYELNALPNITEPFLNERLHKLLNSSSLAAKFKRKLKGYRVYKQPHYHVDPDFFSLTAPVHLRGYFQSELYFAENANLIREKFKFDNSLLSEKTLSYLSLIKNDNTVSVHFRRGDYVSDQKTNEHHGTCDSSYYLKAIDFISSKTSNAHYIIFSDDIPFVKETQLFQDKKHTFIEKSPEMQDYEEMLLMSKCKNNIIANSSFSWWGAWLNETHEKIVIAPMNWFRDDKANTKDLLPADWIKL